MSELQFTTMDRVLSKFGRDLSNEEVSEMDIIEWAGEALEFLRVPQALTESVQFLQVRNFEVLVPRGFHMVLQIARNGGDPITFDTIQSVSTREEFPYFDACGEEEDCGRPVDFIESSYPMWTKSTIYQKQFTPIRLANSSFFKSIVCREKDQTPYESCRDEYTIVGTTQKSFRFSFQEGEVAVSYLKTSVDSETGYPLVPDQIDALSAIGYYIKWKIAERHAWSGREGFNRISESEEAKWRRYARQFKNHMKMPKSLDDFQDLLEISHQMIPNHRRYYNYFGNLGSPDSRKYADPDRRNKGY